MRRIHQVAIRVFGPGMVCLRGNNLTVVHNQFLISSHDSTSIIPDLTQLEGVTAEAPLIFPCIPGLLAFREGPAILAAWEALRRTPDLLLFAGHGNAHPRGIGLASHMVLWLECPSVGLAKSKLYGMHTEPEQVRGDRVPLIDELDRRQAIGVVLRTYQNVKPLYISPGHLIDIEYSASSVMDCVPHYRNPEPIRWAHRLAWG